MSAISAFDRCDNTAMDDPPIEEPASEARPLYRKVRHANGDGSQAVSPLFMITVDVGWRVSILCTGMHECQADWVLDKFAHRPRYLSGGSR